MVVLRVAAVMSCRKKSGLHSRHPALPVEEPARVAINRSAMVAHDRIRHEY